MTKIEKLLAHAKDHKLLAADPGDLVCFFAVDQPLVTKLHQEGQRLWNAAAVCALDPKIRRFLEDHDPKALEQLLDALTGEAV